jgi:hypothetical protein
MSTIKSSTTTTTAYSVDADTTGALVIQTGAAPTTAVTVDASQNTTFAGTVADPTGTLRPLVSGTAVASTSGTSIDFTSIPSWVKRITVMFKGVSANGTSNWLVRLGTSGGIASTGYLGSAGYLGASPSGGRSTTGFIFLIGGSGQIMHGPMVITLQDSATNTWVQQGTLGDSSQDYIFFSGGSAVLSGALDRVRITTVNGTDTFDAGSINILYEG